MRIHLYAYTSECMYIYMSIYVGIHDVRRQAGSRRRSFLKGKGCLIECQTGKRPAELRRQECSHSFPGKQGAELTESAHAALTEAASGVDGIKRFWVDGNGEQGRGNRG